MNATRKLVTGLFKIVVLAAFVFNARADIRRGVSRDQVTRELGYADSRIRIGDIEVLYYKTGTRIRLEGGVVSEIVQRGQTGITRVIHYKSPSVGFLDQNQSSNNEDPRDRSDHRQKVQQGGKTLVLTGRDEERGPAGPRSRGPAKKAPSNTVAQMAPKTTAAAKPVPTKEINGPEAGAVAADNPAVIQQPVKALQTLGSLSTLLTLIQQAAGGLLLLLAAVALGGYLFSCYCFKRICEKAGEAPGAMVWIPIVQCLPLLKAAQLPAWMLILLLIPLVNIVLMVIVWARICAVLGRNPFLAAVLLVPVVNFLLIPYLAFSGTDDEEAESVAPALAPAPAVE
jgi:hypothetical protein